MRKRNCNKIPHLLAARESRPRGETRPSWAAWAEIKGGRQEKNKTPFLFSYHNFKSNLNSNSNSFANSNQTEGSQNKDAAIWMHTHVCRPIFDFIFNKVIIIFF